MRLAGMEIRQISPENGVSKMRNDFLRNSSLPRPGWAMRAGLSRAANGFSCLDIAYDRERVYHSRIILMGERAWRHLDLQA
jgi:hypothetical protein